MEIYNEISKVFSNHPDTLFGFSNIDFSKLKSEYQCALVFAVSHSKMLSLNDYKEEKLQELIDEAVEHINIILKQITLVLKKYNIRYYIPPVAQDSEETLLAQLSFKFAAVNAGLGWIGKNDVLITEGYGPRIRLSAILIDYDLPVGTPIIESKCPTECDMCVKSCPYNALMGESWDITKKRQELIDYKLCNQKRSGFINENNRKNACGICLVACKIGSK